MNRTAPTVVRAVDADAPGYLHEGSDGASVLAVVGAVLGGAALWVLFFRLVGIL